MAYSPTHDAPAGGLPAYTAPDPTQASVAQLDAGLDVQLVERRADWAHIVCSNGWEAWVDARRLVARVAPTPEPTPPPPPPAATAPATIPTTTPAAATPAPAATTETPAVTTATTAPPSQEWAAPATVAPAAASTGGGLKIGPGQIVALAGAAIVLLSAWFSWIDAEDGDTLSAYEIGSKILFDNSIEDKGLIGIGYLLLVCVVAIVVGVFVKPVRFLSIVGGALAAVIALLFVFQVNNFLGNIDDDFGQSIDLFDFITYMPFLALVGGAAAIVGGVLALRQK